MKTARPLAKALHIAAHASNPARVGYLTRTQMEVPSRGSYRWAPAWKITDANGTDIVQPYSRTKTEARSVARELGITIKGEQP